MEQWPNRFAVMAWTGRLGFFLISLDALIVTVALRDIGRFGDH
ncbi:hypothetical protein [Streptomyces natalensis]|nr:hypothetical protein [Streptomyces natalensis]